MQLVTWEEGGYRIVDKPMPRGEVVVGGCSITAGYFNNEDKTNEVYKVVPSYELLLLQIGEFCMLTIYAAVISDTG